MSCASETYSSTIVGSLFPTRYSSSAVTPRSRVRATETANQKPAFEPTANVIPDSTHADPEYVWGDEGPIND
jgi:hypothetical protein